MSAINRFLVIGSSGLVGRHLRDALSDREARFTYRRDTPAGGIDLDVTDAANARRIVSEVAPTVVILAAAEAYVERCEREPVATREVNVRAASVIAEAARAIDALFVVFSSDYVFDGTAGEYGEADQRNPINEYGRQKAALEDIVLARGRGLVCRTSAVFGSDRNRKNFVCQLVDRLRAGQSFVVPSDQLVTPTYAPSLAAAVVVLADGGVTGVLHVAGPDIRTRVDFAKAAASAYGLDIELLRPRPTGELGLAARRPLRCGLRVDKLRNVLGRDLASPDQALREMAAADIT